MKLIIHIGLPKAGSTSLQHLLARDRARLLARGVFVPASGYRKDRSAPEGQTPGHDLLALLAFAPDRLRRLVDTWFTQATAAGCRCILASTENLTHPDNLPHLSSAVHILQAQAQEATSDGGRGGGHRRQASVGIRILPAAAATVATRTRIAVVQSKLARECFAF